MSYKLSPPPRYDAEYWEAMAMLEADISEGDVTTDRFADAASILERGEDNGSPAGL